MDHAIQAEQSRLPAAGGYQQRSAQQGDGTGQQVVEQLHRHLNRALLVEWHGHGLSVGLREGADRGQKVADGSLGRNIAVEVAKAPCIVPVARLLQVAQGLGTRPAIDDLPTEKEKGRDGVKGYPSLCTGPPQQMGEQRTQAAKVDQAQQQVKVRQMLPARQVVQVVAS